MSEAQSLPATLKRLSTSLLEMAHTRLSLASVELAEEKERLLGLLLLALTGCVLLLLSLMTLSALVVVLFWDTWRISALLALTVTYLLAGGLLLLKARTALRNSPPLLHDTLAELEKDRQVLRDE